MEQPQKKQNLKATIPEEISVFLNLKKGDKLEWRPIEDGNERFAIVRRKVPNPQE